MSAWWLLALALGQESPCPLEVDRYLEAVEQEGLEEAYLCLITTDEFKAPLVARVQTFDPESDEDNRLTRALTLHLAARSDEPFDPVDVRLLNPADRRLLADAVKARRGRRSPSAEHEAIFAKQPWYNPRDRFTNNMLSEVERANIDMANRPPPPGAPVKKEQTPAPPPRRTAEAEPAPGPPASPEAPAQKACGCASSGGPSVLWLLPLLGLATRRR